MTAKEHQIIPFCRRDHWANDLVNLTGREFCLVTFDELDKRNVTSLQLYEESVHMDLVEEYQAFRENKNDQKMMRSNLTIFNCSVKRQFGQYCQYSFDSQVSLDNQELIFLSHTFQYHRD